MNEATVFSQVKQLDFPRPVTKLQAEGLLTKFMASLGEPLAYNGVILGHIKVLAAAPAGEEYLFLSLTRLDKVDVKPSTAWSSPETAGIAGLELNINVLVFEFSSSVVEKVVDTAFGEMVHSFESTKV